MINEATPDQIKEMTQFLIKLTPAERELVYSLCLYSDEEQAALIIAYKKLRKREEE